MTTSPPGPLSGTRLVEFDAIGPVPLAGMILADLGCEVVRICRPGVGAFEDVGAAVLHRSRLQVTLDLKDPAGREQALLLIGRADGLVEGGRPGVMERLGLGPEICLARNPRLVFGRMTGWGQFGPMALRAGHDLNYIALTGALHAIGPADGPPAVPLNLIGDYGGGAMFLALGMVAGLMAAQRTGQGQVVDAAMTDGSATLMSLFYAYLATGQWRDRRESNLLDGGVPYYRCYACADGRHVAVGCLEPQFFAHLLKGLGIAPEGVVQHDRASWPALAARIAAVFATKPRDAWAEIFAGTDACVTPVLSLEEAPDHPHNRARGTFISRDGLRQPAPAPRFSVTSPEIRETEACTVEGVLERWG